MRIISISVVRVWVDICVSEHVELCEASTTGRVDGEQYGPGEETADKGDYDSHLEVSKQEESVERRVSQDIRVGYLIESLQPP